jgi:hypothetical protein
LNILIVKLNSKNYEKEHGDNRQSNQSIDCSYNRAIVFYACNFGSISYNTSNCSRDIYCDKPDKPMSALLTFWNQHPEEKGVINKTISITKGRYFYRPFVVPAGHDPATP